MNDLIIMGIKIGVCKSWVSDDDGSEVFIQAEEFTPYFELTKAPKADVISFELISGKYKVWDNDGKVVSEGLIFEQLA